VLSLTPKDRLIFALDVNNLNEAKMWIDCLSPYVGMFKVGPRLFSNTGPSIIDKIHQANSKVFLDLKFHDIPDQVAGAVHEISQQKVHMLTVHSLGGIRMIEEAAKNKGDALCIAVTILTSHSENEIKEIGLEKDISSQVKILAENSIKAGANGIVCSGHELPFVKNFLPPDKICVVPGIRTKEDVLGDQKRTITASQAIQLGATYLVVGRPIRFAKDPLKKIECLITEIEESQKNIA
jgi:orotidine-5'-phosphate decarboxylase